MSYISTCFHSDIGKETHHVQTKSHLLGGFEMETEFVFMP